MDVDHHDGTSCSTWSSCSNRASSSSDVASPSTSFTGAEIDEGVDSDTRVDEDCVRLTEEQYNCISTLVQDPRFQGPWAAKAPLPTWKEMMMREKSEFSWFVHSEWLGSLKFGLVSQAVEGGGALYDDIFSIYERLIKLYDCRLGVVKLCFCHIRSGWFRIQLGKDKPAITHQRRKPTKEAIGRKFRKLSSEAFHMRRTQKPLVAAVGSRRGSRSSEIVKYLPGMVSAALRESNISQPFYYSGDDEAKELDSHFVVGFRDELKRTIAYIGRQLEEGGEDVSWKKLDDDLKGKGSGSILHAMGNLLDSHIKKHGHFVLLRGKFPEDSSTFDSESSDAHVQ